MAEREGDTCDICGYPVAGEADQLCVQCTDWQRVASFASSAIQFNEQRTARERTRRAESLPPAVSLLSRAAGGNAVKAIETTYKGYRFRSRLEARWAVFFDQVGLDFEYEKEGFDLGDLGWYLPDFYLPELHSGLWLEVKPRRGGSADALRKLEAVCTHTNSHGILVTGDPMDGVAIAAGDSYRHGDADGWWLIADSEGKGAFGTWDGPYLFCVCVHCGKVGLEFEGRGGRVCASCSASDKDYSGDHPRIQSAAQAARGARFERCASRPTA